MDNSGYKFISEPKKPGGKPQHLHTLDGEPLYGTSTILSVVSKPLSWWASARAVEHLGWMHSKDPETKKSIPLEQRLEKLRPRMQELSLFFTRVDSDLDYEGFLAVLDEAYKAHQVKLDESAIAGTDMHYELETYVKWCISTYNGKPQLMDECPHIPVRIFAEWATKNVLQFVVSEGYCYSRDMWTGGILDLLYLDNDENFVILDFKSAKEAYDSYFMQNAGYHMAIAENGIFDSEGNLLGEFDRDTIKHYAVLPFGMPNPIPQFEPKPLWKYQEAFKAALTLWRILNDKI